MSLGLTVREAKVMNYIKVVKPTGYLRIAFAMNEPLEFVKPCVQRLVELGLVKRIKRDGYIASIHS